MSKFIIYYVFGRRLNPFPPQMKEGGAHYVVVPWDLNFFVGIIFF